MFQCIKVNISMVNVVKLINMLGTRIDPRTDSKNIFITQQIFCNKIKIKIVYFILFSKRSFI
jgi:hypothetical protein